MFGFSSLSRIEHKGERKCTSFDLVTVNRKTAALSKKKEKKVIKEFNEKPNTR